ncbi:MAG: oxaloacetate decarboxylase [Alphaproteobacteria bacterium]
MDDAGAKRIRLREHLNKPDILIAPGVYDLVSATIADTFGFPALYITGFGVSASHLGLPDAGLLTYTDMEARVRRMAGATKTPMIADADTGFGGLVNVRAAVRGYEAAGLAGIQLEDQEFPKKCGHTPGRRVIPIEDMVDKLRVAREAREDANFLIVARTDARSGYGLDEALSRGEAYAKAGADVLFIESPESEAEMERICRSFDLPLLANMVEGGSTPVLDKARLRELGYRIAIYPVTGLLAAAAALATAYRRLAGEADAAEVPLYPFKDFCRMIGFEEVWDLERRYAR